MGDLSRPRPDPLPPPIDLPSVGRPGAVLQTFGIGVVTVAALYFAREVFVPLALAVLLTFALVPLVSLLRRWRLGRVPSVIAAVLIAFMLIFGLAAVIGSQLAHLADNLPLYQINIREKIESVRESAAGSGVVGRASELMKDLRDEITRATASGNDHKGKGAPAASSPQDAASPTAPPPDEPTAPDKPPEPIPVELHQPAPSPGEVIRTIIGPLLEPLATTGIVIVFVVSFLLQQEDLRDRFIRLAGARDLQRTTRGLDDAAHRLSRYLLVQAAINATFGVLTGTGLWLIGVPNPVLWGMLGMMLRFVPYIGPIIAAAFPVALAIAVDPGWSMVLWTAALYLVVETLAGQLVEPLLYGHSTGLSAVAVVVAAAFWTWLWGPVGLLLSTPLTLCLVVLGRHVEQFEFLDIILGDQPALTLEESFYQRVLANDPDEAAHQAEEFLRDRPLAAYYDEVAIPGLALAQVDVNRGVLEHERRVRIKDAVLGLIDDLSYHAGTLEAGASGERPVAPETPGDDPWAGPAALCVAGRGSLDEAAAAMLAQLLGQQGIGARVVPSHAVSSANIFQLDATEARIVCLSYMEPAGYTNARFLVRRLRRRLPGARIMVGFWTLDEGETDLRDALEATGADLVATSLAEAVERVAAAREAERRGGLPRPAVEAPPAAE